MTIEEMRSRLDELRTEILNLSEVPDDELTDEQNARWDEANDEFDELRIDVEAAEERQRRLAEVRSFATRPANTDSGDGATGGPIVARTEDAHPLEALARAATTEPVERRSLLRDTAMRVLDGLRFDADAHRENADRLLNVEGRGRSTQAMASHIIRTGNPDYVSAWPKLITGNQHMLTPAEQRAAVAIGTNTQGGFLLPTHLDPTVILTNSGASNPFRQISRVETITTNQWNGVSSAGITASYDDELEEVSDDSPEFAQPTVPVHKAQAFAQASYEALQDLPGLASELTRMFADARDRLEATKFAVGSGTGEPTGIVTALDANTNVEVAVTTNNSFGLEDVYKVYEALGERWQDTSTWAMHRNALDDVRQFGTANNYHGFTVDLTAAGTFQILGRPVRLSSAMDSELGTGTDNWIVYGDFSNFLIVDRVGMSVSFIPELFNTATNLPDGRSGWVVRWRNGSDSVNDVAFRLLQV